MSPGIVPRSLIVPDDNVCAAIDLSTGDVMSSRGGARNYFETTAYLERNPIIPIRARLVADLLSDLRNASIVDLGCGDGALSQSFAGNDLTLVDFSEAMIERARQNVPTARHILADALEWEPDGQYDAVIAVGLLAHVTAPNALIEKVASMLKPAGRCILQITDAGRPLGWFLTRCGRFRQRGGYRLNELSWRELAARAGRHGLTAVETRRYGLLLPGLGRLPYPLVASIENAFSAPFLAPLAGDVLGLFRKNAS